MPHGGALHLLEGEVQQFLVDVEKPAGHHLHGEILLQLVLVHSVLSLLHLGHVVAHVPGVKLIVEGQLPLLTLLLLQLYDDCTLFLAQRLQLMAELL